MKIGGPIFATAYIRRFTVYVLAKNQNIGTWHLYLGIGAGTFKWEVPNVLDVISFCAYCV